MMDVEQGDPTDDGWSTVVSSFLIFNKTELLSDLSSVSSDCVPTKYFIESVVGGLESTISAGILPYYLVNESVFSRHFSRFYFAEAIRLRAHNSQSKEESRIIENRARKNAQASMNTYVESKDGFKQVCGDIVAELSKSLQSSDVQYAAEELLVQTLISSWSVFESSVRQFIKDWINIDPKRAGLVLSSNELKSYFGKQVIDISVIGEHGFDLTSSMGDLLFRERKLDSLSIIRSVLNALFDDAGIRDALGADMWMLNQRRHLFVHKRGIVDAEYLSRSKDNIGLGERVRVNAADIKQYISAVQNAAIAIINAANKNYS